MNGLNFYEEFKECLKAVGLDWRQMHFAEVWTEGNALHMRYEHREVIIQVKPEEPTPCKN